MATFPRRQPAPTKRGNCSRYRVYRQEVREDFHGYCAYCGVHERDWPHNQKNYHLDHFKPKGKPEFEDLQDDFYNLRWCCHICNRSDAKGDKWPTPDQEARGDGFVDLCVEDWQDHYSILPDGRLETLTSKAKYTVEIIGLNHEDYIRHRKRILDSGGTIFQAG